MAAKAKSSSSSCLSFLKDALLLPTQNAKLFVPVFLLVTAPLFLVQMFNVFCIQPRTADMLHQLDEIKNMDPSSADYAELMAKILKEARELAIISIAFLITTFAESFARQIIAFFAAFTTYAGDRYSLPELFTEVIMKGRRVRGPLITVAMVAVLNVACFFLLVALLQLAMRHMGVVSMAVLFVLPFLAFLYLNVVFSVAVAASVADADRPRRERAQAGVAADDQGVEEARLRAGRRGPPGGHGSVPALHGCACVLEEEHAHGAGSARRVRAAGWLGAALLLCRSDGVLLPSHGQQGGDGPW